MPIVVALALGLVVTGARPLELPDLPFMAMPFPDWENCTACGGDVVLERINEPCTPL